jgi:hypothetical protein
MREWFALKSSGANRPEGRAYCAAFNGWLQTHHFDIEKTVRSAALDLIENLPAIEQWRSTLPERQRRRLVHPLSVTRRWRTATAPKATPDAVATAEAAWRRFVACMNSLPPDQAAPFWKAAQAQAAAALA